VESELIHSPLFTQNGGDGAAKKKKKKKKEEGRTCGGFEAVLLEVADRRTTWMVVGLSFSSLCFFLLLCSPMFLFFQCFFFCFSRCKPVINDGEDGGSWRWLWGGAGGGYADCSQWFFLLSLLLCFYFQDLAMALVVVLLFFLSVCVASVNNVLLSLSWLCC
jgi:hypothetical protein